MTFTYAFMTVPLKLIFALFIAYILNFKIKGVGLFRTAYYVPSILGGSVAIAVLWKALFKNDGVINTILAMLGFESINFLADKNWALFIICLLRVWQFGSAMVLFLAALKGVPEDLYEAASIDGATKGRQFLSITIPLISPVIFYNLVTQLVQAFQEFNGPYIITNGGPRNATTLISVIVYNTVSRLQGGHVLRDGVGHVRDRDGVDGDRLCQPEEVGLLFRRRWEGLRDEHHWHRFSRPEHRAVGAGASTARPSM